MQLKVYNATDITNEIEIQVFSVLNLSQSEKCKIHGDKMVSYDVGEEKRLVFYCDKCKAFFVDQAKSEILKKYHQRGVKKFVHIGSYKELLKLYAVDKKFIHYSHFLRMRRKDIIFNAEDLSELSINIKSGFSLLPHLKSELSVEWDSQKAPYITEHIIQNVENYFKDGEAVIDTNGDTLLIWLARRNLFESVSNLLERDVKIDHVNHSGNTALVEAAKNNNLESVLLLLNEKNISPERDYEVGNALFSAINCNGVNVIKYLSELLLIHGRYRTLISSALFFAAQRQHIHPASEILNILLIAGADPNITDSYGRTPLHILVRYASLEAISILLDNGADVESRDIMGNNALMYATHDKDKFIRLVEAGADINARYGDGMTLLTKAIVKRDYEETKLLLENGVNPNIEDLAGLTPLHYAIAINNKKIISLLKKCGAK